MTREELLRMVAARKIITSRARAVRLESGLPLETIARELGVSVPTVYRWETGKGRVPAAQAIRYARLVTELERAREAA